MFLDTGLRLSEPTNLKLSDIDFKNGIIKTIGKGKKERYARIGVKTQKALWSYLAIRPIDTEHVWQGKANGKMTKDGIAQMVRKLGKRLDMKLSPHKLRHSFAISFLRNGSNPFELQIALGHATSEMTRRYTQAWDLTMCIRSLIYEKLEYRIRNAMNWADGFDAVKNTYMTADF
jgi:site-specific recombinase XerD